jgi:hypothetical protein
MENFRVVRGIDTAAGAKQYAMTFRRFAARQPRLRGGGLRMRKLCERHAAKGYVVWKYEKELLESMLQAADWAITDDGDETNRWLGIAEEQEDEGGSKYFVMRETAPGVMEATLLDGSCDFTHVKVARPIAAQQVQKTSGSSQGGPMTKAKLAQTKRKNFISEQFGKDAIADGAAVAERLRINKLSASTDLAHVTDFGERDPTSLCAAADGGRSGGGWSAVSAARDYLEEELSDENSDVEDLYQVNMDQVNVEEDRLQSGSTWVGHDDFELGAGADAPEEEEEELEEGDEELDDGVEDDGAEEEGEHEAESSSSGAASRKRPRTDGAAAEPAKARPRVGADDDTSKYVKEVELKAMLRGEANFTIELAVLRKRFRHVYKANRALKPLVNKELIKHITTLCDVKGGQVILKRAYQV